MKTLSESNQREREIEGKSRSSLCQILLKKKCTKNIERIRLHCNEGSIIRIIITYLSGVDRTECN